MNTTTVEKKGPRIVLESGNWIGYDEKGQHVTYSYDQTRTVKMMEKRGFKNVPILGGPNVEAEETDDSPWPINQRYGFVRQLVTMVATGTATSLVILGPAGLGKTHTVRSALQDCGLVDINDAVESDTRTYKLIKGYSTAKAMYRQLYENQNGLIVFDDCDEVIKDATALLLLKGALDSYTKRVISWLSERETDLPASFEFKGRVIFISNLKRTQLQAALSTRGYVVDLKMTLEQKLGRMRDMVKDPSFLPDFRNAHKEESMAMIERVAPQVKEVSLRTLQSVVKIRALDTPGWEDLAEYALTN